MPDVTGIGGRAPSNMGMSSGGTKAEEGGTTDQSREDATRMTRHHQTRTRRVRRIKRETEAVRADAEPLPRPSGRTAYGKHDVSSGSSGHKHDAGRRFSWRGTRRLAMSWVDQMCRATKAASETPPRAHDQTRGRARPSSPPLVAAVRLWALPRTSTKGRTRRSRAVGIRRARSLS